MDVPQEPQATAGAPLSRALCSPDVPTPAADSGALGARYSRHASRLQGLPGTRSYLLLDLVGRVLGGLQVLHQGCVSQKVPGGRRQPGQERVLQLLQDDLELILRFGEAGLQEGRDRRKPS